MNVIWLKDAQDKYYETIDYLANNFPIEVAVALEEEMRKCIEYLKSGFQIGAYSKNVVKKHNLLIYKVIENNIIIADFVPSRSNHEFYGV